MMVSDQEAARVRKFVRDQLRGEPDLSKLTLGILKKRYLALKGLESFNPETRNYMKQVVEEELMKMQDNDEDGGEQETKRPQNKRKRETENDEVKSGAEEEDESRAKKSRCQSGASSESEDEDVCKTGSEKSEKEDQSSSGSEDTVGRAKKSQQKTNAKQTQGKNTEDSSDEEISVSGKKGDEANGGDSPKEGMKKKASTKSGKMKRSSSSSLSPVKKRTSSGEEDESETDKKKDKISGNESSDDKEKNEKVPLQKKNNETDSDSSSLTSVEEDQKSDAENNHDHQKKKTAKKEREGTRGEKEDNKTVVRLKRYIALCGVKKNYKKLLSACRSVRSMVTVLKKELEDLGVDGQPSIKKCKSVKMKREEAQELAELDVSNIIATRGRPKRRAASATWERHDPASSTYKRTLHSGSDSDQEADKSKGHKSTRDWANLQGIISDDADSD